MSTAIKVSVIVPVYNVESYLRVCIDSIIGQTLKEIEVICVDDGSTDSCPKILDEYAMKDPRIRVIHKENSGYGQAINVGFSAARGEYLGIVESDDYILPQMYERLYEIASGNELEVVKSDYYQFFGEYKFCIHKERLDFYYDKVLSEADRPYFFEFDMFNWTGIYKRSFIEKNKIIHNETPGASYQDTGFWLQVMTRCENIQWISEAYYMYRQDNMLCSSKSRGKMLNHKIEYDLFEKNDKNLKSREIINVCRLDIYKFDFYRIDQSLRREFAGIILQDYYRTKDHLFSTDEKRLAGVIKWYEDLAKGTDEFCEQVVRIEKRLVALLRKNENLILYGTGSRGIEVYTKLKNMGMDTKVLFAVNSAPPENTFFGKEIKMPEALKKAGNSLVLISVVKDTTAFNEIEDTLKQMGVQNYCDTEGICSL